MHAPVLERILRSDDGGEVFLRSFLKKVQPSEPQPLASVPRVLEAYDRAEGLLTSRTVLPNGANTGRDLRELLQEKESLLRTFADDPRHEFFIVIPVADRPVMLANCLRSLRIHMEQFPYGREWLQSPTGGIRDKLTVVVVDDSDNPANIARHRNLVEGLPEDGLRSEYFGLEEQQEMLEQFSLGQRKTLCRILGPIVDSSLPGHKGPSVCRNLAYLFLARRLSELPCRERTLIWFVDSDEEFTSVSDDGSGREIPFLHEMDRVFRRRDIEVLTGKVFGDPPVAPAVMVGGLLEDMESFFRKLVPMNPGDPCPFHAETDISPQNAAYNDLRTLFGFTGPTGPMPFQCPRSEPHDARAALGAFAQTLPAFFHGRHPTRPIGLTEVSGDLIPARTVYTGNYVLRPSALNHFIPFAPLRLRMAGPVLGRLLRKRLGDRFVSGPFPLLHRRVLPGQAESEFRAGVRGSEIGHNLSREFEAQFWGDVVLFTVESLADAGYPDMGPGRRAIMTTLSETADRLVNLYGGARKTVTERAERLLALLHSIGPLWTKEPALKKLLALTREIVVAVDAGFSGKTSDVFNAMPSKATLEELTVFIEAYSEDERVWRSIVRALEAGG